MKFLFPFLSRPHLMQHDVRGLLLGFVGVAIFSLTLPLTRVAVLEMHPLLIALGRAVLAALAAAILLGLTRAPLPHRAQLKPLAYTAAGVVFGFPMLTSFAMQSVPATHGAVVLGVLPLTTAVMGCWLNKERPSLGFWLAALIGSMLVIAFALRKGGGSFHLADGALFAAVLAAAFGYAQGAKLSQKMSGQAVISWALLIALPILLPACAYLLWQHGMHASLKAWLCFFYLSFFSMFIGFFFWYKGLALGGVARVSQTQLLQPFLSVLAAWFILGESLEVDVFLFALAVVFTVAIGRKLK